MKAVIGIGTNMGDRLKNVQDAVSAIGLLPQTRVLKQSKIYETKPYGFADQADFINMAVEVETAFSPEALLGACLGIEAGFGRIRRFKNGPRVLDLDLLLVEGFCCETELLHVPHPEIQNRSFVLVPLLDLFPNGIAYDYDFSKAYHVHPKNDIKKYAAE